MSCNCGQLDLLYNFISPVTGRILADPNYVLVGNRNGIAIPSPILIDVRLDLIALRKRYNTLVKGDIIIGHPNNELPNAQVLFNLGEGYLYTTEGILTTTPLIPIGDLPDLEYKHIWIGDITNRPVPQQRVTLDNLPTFLSANPLNNLGLYNLYTGQFSVTSPTQIGQPSITQRIDMSNMPHLSKGKMWIGKINYIPPVITIDGIPPYVHVVGSLNWSAPGIPPGDGDAVPTEIGLNPGEIFIGDPANPGQVTVSNILPATLLPDLPMGNIWIGNNTNRPQPFPYIDITNLPRLGSTFLYGGQIWRGTVSGQAEVSDDLGKLEFDFTFYKNVTAPLAIQAAISALHLVITAEITAAIIAATPGIVATAVSAAATAILPVAAAAAVLYTDNKIDALRLNNILADADVSLYNFKIINLADPINPLDAVNLQTMQAAISGAAGGLISSVTGTVNQITANTVTGAVTLTLPADVIISTSLTAGNLELIGNTLQSNNTNGNIILNPNGTGNIDVNNHKIINLSDPVNPLDAVNLQTLNAAIGVGVINSVSGTTNQITANTVSGAVTLSLPNSVIITTSLQAANMEINTNSLISTNTNGSISIAPNGTGNLLLVPSPSTGNVGVKGTPSYPLDVFGTIRTQRLIGNTGTGITVSAGVTTVTGTGRTTSNDGSELAGSITLTTGTGISIAGTTNPVLNITLSSAMPSSAYTVLLTPGSLTAAGLPLYVIKSTASAFTIRCSAILSNSTVYVFNYHVIGN